MSGDDHRDRHDGEARQLRPEEASALEALRGLESPSASDAAMERARSVFLQGAGVSRGAAPRRGRWAWAAVPLAAALAGLFFYGAQPQGQWLVRDTLELPQMAVGDVVEAAPVSMDAGSELEVQLGDALRVRLLGGTQAVLPQGPGRWLGRSRSLSVTAGEVYGTSGGSLPGFGLQLETPEAVAVLKGTTFAVFRTDEATCFCLYQGRITVIKKDSGEEVELPVGQRIFVYRDGRPHRIEPITAMEQMKLSMMDEGGILAPLPQSP